MALDHRGTIFNFLGWWGAYDSLEKIIHELDGISQVEYTNGFVSLMDVSKTQHQILRMFHCTIPDDYYSNNLAYANRLDKAKKPHGDN